jgi:PatG C-terminal
MEQTEVRQSTSGPMSGADAIRAMNAAMEAAPDVSGTPGSCPTCGAGGASMPVSFVYALGRIEPRIPRLSVEKEIAQAVSSGESAGKTDRHAMQSVLSTPENRYLARQLCWVFTIEGMETYLIVPHDPGDLQRLIETVRPDPRPTDLDVVIGARGPLAPPEMCNGLTVPIVAFDQIYSFDRDSLLRSIPSAEKGSREKLQAAGGEVIDRIMLMADNAGATDDHRALNYLAVRYPAIYHTAAEMYARNASLSALETRPSALSGTRKIIDVIFSYTDRTTSVAEKLFCRVDVTEEFPFLVTKLSPYYDRT